MPPPHSKPVRPGAAPKGPRPPLASVWTPQTVKEGRRIIEHYTATGEFQSGWAALEKLAMQAGVAWAQRLLIDQVGVSPYNREGLAVAAGDAQKHLVDIYHLGFTWTKLEAKAKQTDQHDPEPEIAFNEMQVKLSKGLIPPLSLMLAVSIGGGHTIVGFRQAKHGAKALYKELAGPDGNIDQSKLATGKPEVQDALANGLHWTVFHWQCEDAWPGFSQFAQKSLNTIAQSLRQLCFFFKLCLPLLLECFSTGASAKLHLKCNIFWSYYCNPHLVFDSV